MQGVGAKLSKHVLGMKFMRKTKDQLDKDTVEKTHRKHFSLEISSEDTVSQTLTANVEEVPSYSQCIGFNFGRVSFGGFNPTVEYHVNNGSWKAVHAGRIESDEEGEIEDETVEKEVPDEEMARTYGSLIGTLGKHFKNKRDRGKDGKSNSQEESTSSVGGDEHEQKRGKGSLRNQGEDAEKKGRWGRKGKGWNKGQQRNHNDIPSHIGSSGSRSQTSQSSLTDDQLKKHGGLPPQKKRKFWKPSD